MTTKTKIKMENITEEMVEQMDNATVESTLERVQQAVDALENNDKELTDAQSDRLDQLQSVLETLEQTQSEREALTIDETTRQQNVEFLEQNAENGAGGGVLSSPPGDLPKEAPTPPPTLAETRRQQLAEFDRQQTMERLRLVAAIHIGEVSDYTTALLNLALGDKPNDNDWHIAVDNLTLALADIKTNIDADIHWDVATGKFAVGRLALTTPKQTAKRSVSVVRDGAGSTNRINGAARALASTVKTFIRIADGKAIDAMKRGRNMDRNKTATLLRTNGFFPTEWKGFVDGNNNPISTVSLVAMCEAKGIKCIMAT